MLSVTCLAHPEFNAKYYCKGCEGVVCDQCYVNVHVGKCKKDKSDKDLLLDKRRFARYAETIKGIIKAEMDKLNKLK